MPRPDHHCSERSGKLTAAAVTGLIAGVARAIAEWLLHHLTSIW